MTRHRGNTLRVEGPDIPIAHLSGLAVPTKGQEDSDFRLLLPTHPPGEGVLWKTPDFRFLNQKPLAPRV
jgi:hypothetical protein